MKALLSFILAITSIGYVFGYIDLEPNQNAVYNWQSFADQAEKVGDQFMTTVKSVTNMVGNLGDTLQTVITGPQNLGEAIDDWIKGIFSGNNKGPFGGGGGSSW